MKRERATALIEDLLERVAPGDRYLDCIDEIWVFGSYARGALEPGDVDLEIEYTPDDEFRAFQIQRLARGGSWLTPLDQAVVGRRRGFQVSYERRDLYQSKGIELTLLFRRGDDLASALERLHAINPDSAAGRAPRTAMLPAFEGIDRWVPLPIREMLVPLVDAGALIVERIELPDSAPKGRVAARYVRERWQEGSPLRRAGLTALAYIEATGGNPRATHLQGQDVDARDTPHYVSVGWRYYQSIPHCLAEFGGDEWIEVLNPTRTPGPARAADRAARPRQAA